MLELKNVTYGYTKGAAVLQDFSMTFEEGGIYGLLGKNGTGKSTLLYLMMGLLHAQQGCIAYNWTDVRERRPEVLQDMFIVPEEYDLPNITLRKLVERVRPFYPRFSDELLQGCLRDFDMTDDVHMRLLSMGQKKKIYMSLALAANTRMLLMDEPTNGLDIPSKSQFRKVVSGCMDEDKTIIISTHQVRDVELLLDRLAIIDVNRVLLQASMAEVGRQLAFTEVNHLPNETDGGVLYFEQTYHGFSVVAPNTTQEETPVNLELLFNALLANPQGVQQAMAQS